MTYKFGDFTIPVDGRVGPWLMETFTLTDADVALENMRARMSSRSHMLCSPGTYRALRHDRRGVVMSNTPMEVRTNRDAYLNATGRVLINGLGMGMLIEGLLSKTSVESIRIIEIDADVIELVGKHFTDSRVEIINADAFEYKPAKFERFKYVWHDIWDTISSENLGEMATLARKYGRRCDRQGFWSKELALQDRRRYG